MAVFIQTPNRGDNETINVFDRGGRPDGVKDLGAVLNTIMEDLPEAVAVSTTRSVGGGTIEIPPPPPGGEYALKTQLVRPNNKNLKIKGLGFNVSSLVAPDPDDASAFDFALRIDGGGGLRVSIDIENIGLVNCGIDIRPNNRNYLSLRKIQINNAGHANASTVDGKWSGGTYAIRLGADSLGAVASIIGGVIEDIRIVDCYGGLIIEGDQCDNWVLRNFHSLRCSIGDFVTYSSGWTIEEFVAEQRVTSGERAVANAHIYPHMQFLQGNNTVRGGRHGNEVTGTAQPPRENIVVGALESSESGHLTDLRFIDINHEGRGDGGPTATSAAAAYRFNKGVNNTHIVRPRLSTFGSAIQFAHANGHDGRGNKLDLPGFADLKRTMPVFSPLEPARGSYGSWDMPILSSSGSDDRPTKQLVKRTDTIHSASQWAKTNVSVAKDATGPDGVANSGYTMTKLGSGSGFVLASITAPDAQGPHAVSIWGRKPSGSDIDYLRFFVSGRSREDAGFLLTESWQLFEYAVDLEVQSYNVQLCAGLQGDSSVDGSIEFAWPQVEPGEVATPFMERSGTTTTTRDGGWKNKLLGLLP